ncbi:hypothetical protein CSKR_105782 [Clonorchis sinensis]|uniref:Uncharacterized protein n=1 Tax=Clonorchis sinensis TaxID=79923 RepID=A0A3R7CGM4_CLOSI|nr:hypothetical protein CSKR_105782 [Clonorchis sinensis]
MTANALCGIQSDKVWYASKENFLRGQKRPGQNKPSRLQQKVSFVFFEPEQFHILTSLDTDDTSLRHNLHVLPTANGDQFCHEKDIFEESQIPKSFLGICPRDDFWSFLTTHDKGVRWVSPYDIWTHFSSFRGRCQSNDHWLAASTSSWRALALELHDFKSSATKIVETSFPGAAQTHRVACGSPDCVLVFWDEHRVSLANFLENSPIYIDTQDRGFHPSFPGRFCSCRLAAVVKLKGTSEKRKELEQPSEEGYSMQQLPEMGKKLPKEDVRCEPKNLLTMSRRAFAGSTVKNLSAKPCSNGAPTPIFVAARWIRPMRITSFVRPE